MMSVDAESAGIVVACAFWLLAWSVLPSPKWFFLGKPLYWGGVIAVLLRFIDED